MYSLFTGRGPENDALGLKSECDTGKKLVPNLGMVELTSYVKPLMELP